MLAALERDTQFLALHKIMDYSLLLGVRHPHLILRILTSSSPILTPSSP